MTVGGVCCSEVLFIPLASLVEVLRSPAYDEGSQLSQTRKTECVEQQLGY